MQGTVMGSAEQRGGGDREFLVLQRLHQRPKTTRIRGIVILCRPIQLPAAIVWALAFRAIRCSFVRR